MSDSSINATLLFHIQVWNMTNKLADSGCVRYVDLTTLSKTNVSVNVTCIVVSDNMSNMAIGE